MIIVLGESVAALVLTAAQTEWTRDFVGTSIAGFLLLVLLWLLTFSYGFASAPGVRPGSMPPRFGLPLHLASTLGILLIGVGLGEAVTLREPMHGLMLWVLVGGVALHSAASLVAGLLGHAASFWVWSCAVPAIGFALLLGVVGSVWTIGNRPQLLVWLLALPVLWQFLYAQRSDALLALRKREPDAG